MRRRFRLRLAADFESLRRQGQHWHHPIVVLIVKTNDQPVSRFGFSASRRVGKATGRNRAKRLMREAVRRRLALIQAGWDCLFIAKKGAAEATLDDIDAAILQLLRDAALVNEDTQPGPARNHLPGMGQ